MGRPPFWTEEFDKVVLNVTSNPAILRFVEVYLILKNKPKYNIDMQVEEVLPIDIENIFGYFDERIIVGASFGVNISNNFKKEREDY